jgi:hypothetical protein
LSMTVAISGGFCTLFISMASKPQWNRHLDKCNRNRIYKHYIYPT